ncbi:MAG: hypothetical protein K6F98_07885 [Bacteroidales bacterium]|nr:hypothetical protein [Bacteroidales bacterium]
MITVANKKRGPERIQKDYPGAYILDITSSSPYHYGQILSPFYPHRNIPIPGDSRDMKATCVEAIWQGLKVFEGADIDIQMFRNDTMKNIKRTVRKFGRPLGHRYGVYSQTILNYADARRYIYIPSYKYVLDYVPEVQRIVAKIREKAKESDIVLLDYNLNPDNRDITKPLSHAELVKMYIEGRYPSRDEDFVPFTDEELKARKKTGTKRSAIRKKLSTDDDEAQFVQDVVELLQKSERSPKEICAILSIDEPAKTIKKLVESIPGITSKKEKRTIYYTLKGRDSEPTLF